MRAIRVAGRKWAVAENGQWAIDSVHSRRFNTFAAKVITLTAANQVQGSAGAVRQTGGATAGVDEIAATPSAKSQLLAEAGFAKLGHHAAREPMAAIHAFGGKSEALCRVVIIVRQQGRLLFFRRPLTPQWTSLIAKGDVHRIKVTSEVHPLILESEQERCLAVPGKWGFLTGLVRERMIPLALSHRLTWLQNILRLSVGESLAAAAELCGFNTLGWNEPGGRAFPVLVHVFRIPPSRTEFTSERINCDMKLVRAATREMLFRELAPKFADAAVVDAARGADPSRTLNQAWKLVAQISADDSRTSESATLRDASALPASAAASSASVDSEAGEQVPVTIPGHARSDTRVSEAAAGEAIPTHSARGAAPAAGAPPKASVEHASTSDEDRTLRLWGGDQAEAARWFMEADLCDAEPAAACLLCALSPDSWKPLQNITSLDRRPGGTQSATKLPTEVQSETILRWASFAIGAEWIRALTELRLTVSTSEGYGSITPPRTLRREARESFVRGSIFEAYALARVVLGQMPDNWETRSGGKPGTGPAREEGYGTWCPPPVACHRLLMWVKADASFDSPPSSEDGSGPDSLRHRMTFAAT